MLGPPAGVLSAWLAVYYRDGTGKALGNQVLPGIQLREAFRKKKSQNCGPFPYGGGQPHSVAFGGVFPNITETILIDEICTKVRIYCPKVII